MHILNVGADGTVRMIYDDVLAVAIAEQGTQTIKRASHVEPIAGGGWSADMSPVGGPVLGPFRLHREAIAAERQWINNNYL